MNYKKIISKRQAVMYEDINFREMMEKGFFVVEQKVFVPGLKNSTYYESTERVFSGKIFMFNVNIHPGIEDANGFRIYEIDGYRELRVKNGDIHVKMS